MQWEKKICIRITARRIAVAILIAASSVNLIIVGAAFEVASTATSTPTIESLTITTTATFSLPTATPENTRTPLPSPTETHTLTSSPTFTSSPTATPTSTSTNLPTPTQCVPKTYWFVYYIQSGDTLYSLALSTDSSVGELMLANCLSGTLIYSGQVLYVPRLPIKTPIFTPSYTPTQTKVIVTDTQATATDTKSVFQNPSLCLGYGPYYGNYLAFSITVSNLQDVKSVTAISGKSIKVSLADIGGGNYYGRIADSGEYSPQETVSYYFIAVDNLGRNIQSNDYSTNLIACSLG